MLGIGENVVTRDAGSVDECPVSSFNHMRARSPDERVWVANNNTDELERE
jgi:hypothetical protein